MRLVRGRRRPLVERVLRHRRRTPALALLVVVAAAVGLTRLQTSASTRTLVGESSSTYRAGRQVASRFGDDAIVVLVRAGASTLVRSGDLSRLAGLEGCLAGSAPAGQPVTGGVGGPCDRLRDLRPAKVVYGPGTIAQTLLDQVSDGIRQAAASGLSRRQTTGLLEVAREYGINPLNPPTLTDTAFVERLLLDPSKPTGTPRTRFAAVFPTRDAALVAVRLRAGLDDAQRRRAVALVREAVAMPEWRLRSSRGYVVSGSPVLVDAVAAQLEHALVLLFVVGIVVMALVLGLVFSERRRLRPLLLALGALGVTFGGLGLFGLPLDLGTIATLPVLLGLAVDYGVQLHARVEEAARSGLSGRAAVTAAVARGGRPVVVAAGATVAGFAALLSSPIPLVRGFALVLAAGVVLAVFISFTVGMLLHAGPSPEEGSTGPRARARTPSGSWPRLRRRVRRPLARVGRAAGSAGRAAGRVGRRGRRRWDVAGAAVVAQLPVLSVGTGPFVRRAAALAHRRPVAVLVVGCVLAVGGALLGARTPVETDVQRLVPADLPALRDLHQVQRRAGVSSEIQVLVRAPNVTTPAVLRWMAGYRSRVLDQTGYAAAAGCTASDVCPETSPSDVVDAKTRSGGQSAIDTRLAQVPDYLSQASLSTDRTAALLTFGLPLTSSERQRAIVRSMRADLDPPTGVRATVTGLPVLVTDAAVALSSPARRLLTLLGSLLLVGGFLALVARSPRGLVAVVPVALAAGWAGLIAWLLRVPLNPLSVVLGALVVAIGTEFSVLLVERYRQEREDGHAGATAIARTARSTGRAVGASAATAIAGFAVLAVSDIPLLRQFGLLTVVDLLVAVAAVVLVLPALAALGDRRDARRTP